ncbi:LIM-domain-containing protein [Phanerochaete sordida]|uniref:Cysteine-rich protein 1 n=1 Tax=Phanerochaete sordida TaxID=48140 RepID=A0A9P3GIN5_9APHY|nr:LIM-domain-containing protein [Phanerochaete sordida]
MHPYGGTPICPRCNKAVYAAEQIMGPGRKLYHKPCLACTTCKKRLDSYSLVEHNEEPYCKTCHVKNFGTRDLRHANLPDRDDVFLSPPTSPARVNTNLPSPRSIPPALPSRPASGVYTGSRDSVTSPIFKPTHTWSPKRASFGAQVLSPTTPPKTPPPHDEASSPVATTPADDDDDDWAPPVVMGTPSHAGRGSNGLPRTVALESAMTGPPRTPSPVKKSRTTDGVSASPAPAIGGRMTIALGNTPTGTRYGAALGGRSAPPMAPMPTGRAWGGNSNPVCPKCQKTVYFAEQVKAVGKTWHRNCLRCTECGTTLDSTRLTENEGVPFCKHCYGKLHGPAGNGYALLGKAGG